MPVHALESELAAQLATLQSQIAAFPKGGMEYTIAASDAPAAAKARADYICTGINDDVVINAIIMQLYANGGGGIKLTVGTFFLSNPLALYGTSSVTTPTVKLTGAGMDATYLRPVAGVHAITVGKSTQACITDVAFELDGSSDGIHDIDGLTSSDGIGWRMRHSVINNIKWSGTSAHTGWGINIQPFRCVIGNLEGNAGRTGYTYPANGMRLFAASTPNTGATFNAGDSVVGRVQISISGLLLGTTPLGANVYGKGIWIDTDDATATNYDSSYFNQMVFTWVGLRSNVNNIGTAFQIGHAGSNKTRSILVLGMDMEQFNVGIDLYNTQLAVFNTFYTSLVAGSGGIYFRTDNTGTVNNTVNNEWHMGTVGVFNSTQDVIVDANTDANNPNRYYGGMVETSGGVARINGSATATLPAGVLVKNIGGVQRLGTRHPAFNEPLLPQAQVSGLSTALVGKLDKYTAPYYNLIPSNPSFELPFATGWTAYGVTTNTIDTTNFFVGTQSASISSASATDGGIQSAAFTLPAGTYTLSAYLKMTSNVTRAALVLRGANGTSGTQVQLNPAYPGNTNFNRYTATFTTVASGQYIILMGLGYGGTSPGTVNFDALQLELASAATTYFDGSLAPTTNTTYAWTGTAHASTSYLQNLNVVTSVNGQVGAVMGATSSAPALATSAGTAGMVAYDSGFLYICIAANTWKRVAVATF